MNRSSQHRPVPQSRPHSLASRALALVALAGASLAFAPGVALAQQGIGEEIPQSTSLTQSQTGTIIKHVGDNKAGLSGEDFVAIRRARNALIQPLRVSGVSNSFRVEYAKQLVPVITPLVTSTRDEVAINAVRIAGELGTKSGMDILDGALKDKRESVRVVAAMGYARTFGTAREGNNGLLPAQVTPVVANLVSISASEKSPAVLEAIMAALENAAQAPDDTIPGLRVQGLDALGLVSSALAQRATDEQIPAVLQGTDALAKQLGRVAGTSLDPKIVKSAGGAAGDAGALIVRRLGSGDVSPQVRTQLGQLGDHARSLYNTAAGRAGASATVTLQLGDLVRDSEDDKAKTDASKLFEALSKQPFGLDAARFQK